MSLIIIQMYCCFCPKKCSVDQEMPVTDAGGIAVKIGTGSQCILTCRDDYFGNFLFYNFFFPGAPGFITEIFSTNVSRQAFLDVNVFSLSY